jgi:nitroimidazol reductase NimA-like FMN-containing flavoprotein (pyridoxamine 5'-phosphate oxidase superfamily)
MLKILDGSPGIGVPLTEQETKDFLTAGKLNLHLGTIDEKGHANIHPAWYYYDSLNNKFYILTGKESKKVSNLKRNELVYFCVDDHSIPKDKKEDSVERETESRILDRVAKEVGRRYMTRINRRRR